MTRKGDLHKLVQVHCSDGHRAGKYECIVEHRDQVLVSWTSRSLEANHPGPLATVLCAELTIKSPPRCLKYAGETGVSMRARIAANKGCITFDSGVKVAVSTKTEGRMRTRPSRDVELGRCLYNLDRSSRLEHEFISQRAQQVRVASKSECRHVRVVTSDKQRSRRS